MIALANAGRGLLSLCLLYRDWENFGIENSAVLPETRMTREEAKSVIDDIRAEAANFPEIIIFDRNALLNNQWNSDKNLPILLKYLSGNP